MSTVRKLYLNKLVTLDKIYSSQAALTDIRICHHIGFLYKTVHRYEGEVGVGAEAVNRDNGAYLFTGFEREKVYYSRTLA
jgi:hypothetical protein